jgi:hypothetical protein
VRARSRLAALAVDVRRLIETELPEGGELRLALLGGVLRDLLAEAETDKRAKADG